jgi:nucleotide-binding universal stress UspA family protein
MENYQRPILVPWDYTPVSEYAFEHALVIANAIKKDIVLLHIVADEKSNITERQKLQLKCDELKSAYGVTTSPLIMNGNIFTAIGDAASQYKAEMVVMGTHGRKGAQKLFGSRALKVIAHSKVPFVVVQGKPVKPGYEIVVFPVDFRKETKEKVAWANFLSKNFNSKFLVYRRKSSDQGFKKNIASNLLYFETFFKNNDIAYELHSALGESSFEKETVEFAKKMSADMILVLTTRDISFVDYILGAKEQYIIANPEKLTVMCVNPKPVKVSGGFRATGG